MEIDRRVGRTAVDAAREEGYQMAVEERARAKRYYKELTKRLSNSSSDPRIVLESVQPFMEANSQLEPDTEEQLGEFVRTVEKFVLTAISDDTRPFHLHISATLTPTEQAQYQTSASLNAPEAYMKIYRDLPNLRVPQWSRGRLSVALDFTIRAKP
jgi:hypothetical protein